MVVTRGWGVGKREFCLMGIFSSRKQVLETDGSDSCTTM